MRPGPIALVIVLTVILAAAWPRLFVVHLAAGGSLAAFQGGHEEPTPASKTIA